jgi:hypothetical protein
MVVAIPGAMDMTVRKTAKYLTPGCERTHQKSGGESVFSLSRNEARGRSTLTLEVVMRMMYPMVERADQNILRTEKKCNKVSDRVQDPPETEGENHMKNPRFCILSA